MNIYPCSPDPTHQSPPQACVSRWSYQQQPTGHMKTWPILASTVASAFESTSCTLWLYKHLPSGQTTAGRRGSSHANAILFTPSFRVWGNVWLSQHCEVHLQHAHRMPDPADMWTDQPLPGMSLQNQDNEASVKRHCKVLYLPFSTRTVLAHGAGLTL